MQLTQRLSADHLNSGIPPGLPNLGQTCFLNSVIQILYTIPSIHDFFHSLDIRAQEKGSLILLTRQLFFLMNSSNKQAGQIEKATRSLAKSLEKQLSRYHFGHQYDSLETFLCFIDNFFKKSELLSQQFKIMYLMKCKCPNLQIQITQIKIQGEKVKCQTCGGFVSKKITKFPRYLIVIGQKNHRFVNQLSKEGKYYKTLGHNIYIGTGNVGHYYSICSYNKKQFIFNDSSVSQLGRSKYPQSILFSVYQRSIQKESDRNIPRQTSCTARQRIGLVGILFIILMIFCFLIDTSLTQKNVKTSNAVKSGSKSNPKNLKRKQEKATGKNKRNRGSLSE